MSTLEDGNLETLAGQTSENVGQEEGGHQDENSTNWQEQAKYFQSEKDKLYTENQKLRDYEKLGTILESRPDIANAVTGMLQGGQPNTQERVELSKDDFDPWEAYNDPSSKSYKYREQELSDRIQTAVDTNMEGMQQKVGMQNLEQQLRSKGLGDEEVKSFFDFASKNPVDYGVDGVMKMWQAVTQQPQGANKPNPLDAVRNNQTMPQQAGVLNGQQPQVKSEDAERWKNVLSASRVGNKIP